ncbi:hypothetical protein A5652_25215 [Mycobacterium sp. 1165178.9]|nr:hypothetical protein A5652_25215 [Mycobacterium sp. 1165178.9]
MWRSRCSIGRARRRLDRRLNRFALHKCHRSAASRGLDLGQILGDAFEVFRQVGGRLGDASQRIPGTGDPAGTAGGTSGLYLRLGAACSPTSTVRGCAGFTGPGHKQRCHVEQVLARAQSRPGSAPILGMHKAFQLLQLGVREFFGMQRSIDQTPLPRALP